MRRMFLMLLSAGMISGAMAQTTTKSNPGGLFIKGGVNFANISTTSSGKVDEAKMLTSFQAGILGDIALTDVFSFQTGLLLTGKGSKTEIYANNNNTADNYYKIQTNPLYLEVPANLVFKVPMTSSSRFYFGAGPYAAVGIAGKTKGQQKFLGVESSYEKDIEFNNDDPLTSGQEDAGVNKLRRFDFGLNGLAGIETSKMLIGVNYGYGFSKIGSAEANNDDANKHRVWSLTLGFKL